MTFSQVYLSGRMLEAKIKQFEDQRAKYIFGQKKGNK